MKNQKLNSPDQNQVPAHLYPTEVKIGNVDACDHKVDVEGWCAYCDTYPDETYGNDLTLSYQDKKDGIE